MGLYGHQCVHPAPKVVFTRLAGCPMSPAGRLPVDVETGAGRSGLLIRVSSLDGWHLRGVLGRRAGLSRWGKAGRQSEAGNQAAWRGREGLEAAWAGSSAPGSVAEWDTCPTLTVSELLCGFIRNQDTHSLWDLSGVCLLFTSCPEMHPHSGPHLPAPSHLEF